MWSISPSFKHIFPIAQSWKLVKRPRKMKVTIGIPGKDTRYQLTFRLKSPIMREVKALVYECLR